MGKGEREGGKELYRVQQPQKKKDSKERRDAQEEPNNLCLKIVHAEPNNRTAEVFAIQNGLTRLIKPRVARVARVVPDVLEVDDPQPTELVADDVSACQVAVDEAEIVEIAHGMEEVLPANIVMGLAFRQCILPEMRTNLSCSGN